MPPRASIARELARDQTHAGRNSIAAQHLPRPSREGRARLPVQPRGREGWVLPTRAVPDLGQVADGFSVIDLMAQGVQRALDDCGLQLKDVDGVFAATTQSRLSVLALSEYLGLNPPFLGSTIVGGSSFEYHVAHAMSAIEQGLCSVAVIAYGSTQRSVGRKQASVRQINPYESPFKPFMPSSAYALAASRHMHQFGTTREQMAAVAVAAR